MNLYVKNSTSGAKAIHITYDSKDYHLSFYKEDENGIITVPVYVSTDKMKGNITVSLKNGTSENTGGDYTISVCDYFDKLIVGERIVPQITTLEAANVCLKLRIQGKIKSLPR